VNNTETSPAVYADTLDPHHNALHVSHIQASTYDGKVPVVSLAITSDVSCNEDDNIVYVRLEDVEHVIDMIRAAAEGVR
jgi:hypothetical protein